MIPYTENKKGNELDPITIGNDKYVLIAHPSTGVLYKCLVSELASFIGASGVNLSNYVNRTTGQSISGNKSFLNTAYFSGGLFTKNYIAITGYNNLVPNEVTLTAPSDMTEQVVLLLPSGTGTVARLSDITDITGLLASLNTTDKSNLVAAINEALASRGRPYKVYTALLTQEFTNDPDPDEIDNEIGAIGFARDSAGEYRVTSAGLFVGYVELTFGAADQQNEVFIITRNRAEDDDSNLHFGTAAINYLNSGNRYEFKDNCLYSQFFEIRVYP